MQKLRVHLLASIIYNLLLKGRFTVFNNRYLLPVWQWLWYNNTRYFKKPVRTYIHDTEVIVNNGYLYPLYARQYKTLNNPLVELVNQCFISKKSKINLIDVGAAVGDTALLIHSNCPNMFDKILCVDGDKEFFRYLEYNLSHLEECKLVYSVLSSEDYTLENELVRTHSGTASSQGALKVKAQRLDSALINDNYLSNIDLIKIDTDGFDGKVLEGAELIIKRDHPAVLFEWHPILYKKTNNNLLNPFHLLETHGYHTFLWYNKYGEFSHFMYNLQNEAVSLLADICLANIHEYDWHYDVIAIHKESSISPVALAELQYAKNKTSPY